MLINTVPDDCLMHIGFNLFLSLWLCRQKYWNSWSRHGKLILVDKLKIQVDKFWMNFLCNINQSFAGLLINYLKLRKGRSSCLEMFYEKSVLRKLSKFLRTTFKKNTYGGYFWKSKCRQSFPLCSVTVGEENISG